MCDHVGMLHLQSVCWFTRRSLLRATKMSPSARSPRCFEGVCAVVVLSFAWLQAKAASVKDGLELQRQRSGRVQLLQDADPAVQAGAQGHRRRIWLQEGVEGNPYSVFLDADAIGDDLRRLAAPDMSDRQRANIKLFEADGTELRLDGEVPLDAGSLSTSAIRLDLQLVQGHVLSCELWGTYASV